MSAEPAALVWHGVTRRFGGNGEAHTALANLTLAAESGRITCVLGPSGCGKTTLLRLAAGLDRPDAGTVCVDGVTVTQPRPDTVLVTQEADLLPWRSALDNVALGLQLRGVARREREERARRALEHMRLPAATHRRRPHELSGGMRQRVALARAWCLRPRLLLLDEPFARLDEATREDLQDELIALWRDTRPGLVFVTHSIEEAVYLADHIAVMAPARLRETVAVDLPRPRDRFAAAFTDLLLRVRRMARSAG